jgi:hypothetical protein
MHTHKLSALLLVGMLLGSLLIQGGVHASTAAQQVNHETKVVYLGKELSVPLAVPVKAGTPFTWSGLLIDTLKQTGVTIGSTLGFKLITAITGNFFGLLDAKPDTQVMDKLKEIERLVQGVDYKIDSLQKDVARVQISVQLGNVKLWATELQSMFDIMLGLMENAPYQSPNVTKDNINRLVDQVKRSAYRDALGIYNAMIVPTPVEDPILFLGYKYIMQTYADNTDALDVYGILRSFSSLYLSSLAQASTLLNFAGNYTKDTSTLELANKVDLFVANWDKYLETGSKPLISTYYSRWARDMLLGSPDETHIGWNVQFKLGNWITGSIVQCNNPIVMGIMQQSPVSLRRQPDNSWKFASTAANSAQPECLFVKNEHDDDLVPIASPNPQQPAYLWNIYASQEQPQGIMLFAVRGYANSADRINKRNEFVWQGHFSEKVGWAVLGFEKPTAGRDYHGFSFMDAHFYASETDV